MPILDPTYITKIFIGRIVMTTYVIPFVIGMLLPRDSIVDIFIPSSILLPASLFTHSVIHHLATNSVVTLLASFLGCLLPRISVLAENTLLKTNCHFLLLLIGFDTLTYKKDYDRSPILVGHQYSFLVPLQGSVALLVGGIW